MDEQDATQRAWSEDLHALYLQFLAAHSGSELEAKWTEQERRRLSAFAERQRALAVGPTHLAAKLRLTLASSLRSMTAAAGTAVQGLRASTWVGAPSSASLAFRGSEDEQPPKAGPAVRIRAAHSPEGGRIVQSEFHLDGVPHACTVQIGPVGALPDAEPFALEQGEALEIDAQRLPLAVLFTARPGPGQDAKLGQASFVVVELWPQEVED